MPLLLKSGVTRARHLHVHAGPRNDDGPSASFCRVLKMTILKGIAAFFAGAAPDVGKRPSDRTVVVSVLAAIVVIKASVLVLMGPMFQIDSTGYVEFADVINRGFDWMRASDPHQTGVASFRMIGYPAILAGAKVIFGDYFAWAVVAFQTALSVFATALFFRAATAVTGSVRVAALLVIAYLLSPAFQYDLFILTDSIYGSLFTILTSVILTAWAGRRPASTGVALALGLLLAASFLIRETSLLFGMLFLPLILVWASIQGWRASVLAGLLFLLPPGMTWEGYRHWNEYRTGEMFITTGTGSALLYALASMDSLDRQLFAQDTPVDNAVRDSRIPDAGASSAVFMLEAVAGLRILGDRYGMSGTDIERAVRTRYLRIVWSHPALIVRKMRQELMSDTLWGEINPARTVRELIWWREKGEFEGIRAFIARLAAERRASDIAFLPLEGFSRAAGAICWLAFLGTPIVAGFAFLRRRDQTGLLFLALFVPPAGVIAAYSMVHLEQRHLIGFIPAILLCAIQTLRTLFSRRAVGDPGEPLTHYSHASLS